MKAITFSLFAIFAVAGVSGGSIYGEKEDAIKDIRAKYDEVFKFAHSVIGHIINEKGKTEPKLAEDSKKHAELLKTTHLTEFSSEVKRVARTAITKSKPLSTFECIASASMEGRTQVLAVEKDFINKVSLVSEKRSERLYLAEVEAAVILNAVTELKDESLRDIEKASSGLQSLKSDALKKIDTGKKQLSLLESSILKPTLAEEYISLNRDMDSKFKEVKEALFKRVQKCLL